jgi:hypothetical protein
MIIDLLQIFILTITTYNKLLGKLIGEDTIQHAIPNEVLVCSTYSFH